MSEMIERVARAINLSVWDELELPPVGTIQRAFAIQHARAAIEAMREPDQSMVEAVKPVPEHLIAERKNVPGYEMAMRAAALADQMTVWSYWQAMIDAALSRQIVIAEGE